MIGLPGPLAWLAGWKGAAAGAVLCFGAGVFVGQHLAAGHWAPKVTEATDTIANLQREKANTATAALQALNQLALDAREAEASAQLERQNMEDARQQFITERRANVSQGTSTVCSVSESDVALGRMLDSRLFRREE